MSGSNLLPLWRSMLFIPVHVSKFVEKAHTRGADALILDLEDSVPLAEKEFARQQVIAAAATVSKNGADVLVRINAPLRLAVRDLEAIIDPLVTAVIVPKVESAQQLVDLSDVIDELEIEQGAGTEGSGAMSVGRTKLIALVESPQALTKLDEIANACPRLVAMIIGSEDFSAAAGMIPNADNLLFPNQQLLFAARAAGRLPLGYAGSIADYSDLAAFEEIIVRARNMGFRGGFCIHPNQVDVLNRGFSPTNGQIEEAQGIIDAYQEALKKGRGAIQFKGKMVDAPVVARAKEVLTMAKNLN